MLYTDLEQNNVNLRVLHPIDKHRSEPEVETSEK